MLTCQLLCEVLLDCPLVWSKINIGWPRAQCELYTTLARGAPLSVRDSNSSVDPQCYFEVATSEHLDFTILYPNRRILINEALKRDAPQVKVLTVVGTQIPIHEPRAYLTSDFLSGNPRALRELTLVGFQLTSAPNFGGLKRLTLHVLKFILNAEYVAFTINSISIFGIDFMPNIHTIILENVGDHADILGDSGLEEFIDARVNSMQPIFKLKFVHCAEALRAYATQLTGRWSETEIFWNGEAVDL
jgi:hypothetical protein